MYNSQYSVYYSPMTTTTTTHPLAGATLVETLSNRVESSDSGDYRYLVKVRWEYETELYVLETPADTDDVSELRQLFQSVYPRDEGIANFELVAQF